MEDPVTIAVDDITLEGLFAPPDDPDSVGVVLCHPHPLYGGEMRNNVVTAFADAFQKVGMATLRFNFRGVGGSGGSHGGGEAEQADVAGAISCLLDRCSPAKLIVCGYSFGSMVGLRVAADDHRVDAMIGIGVPVERIGASDIDHAGKPILLISGDSDHVSELSGLQKMADELPEPKRLVVLEGTDHFLIGHEGEATDAALQFISKL